MIQEWELNNDMLQYKTIAKFLPEWRGVVGDDDQLGLSLSESLQSLPVAQLVLTRLHDKGEPRVDGLCCLLNLLLGNHFDCSDKIEKPVKIECLNIPWIYSFVWDHQWWCQNRGNHLKYYSGSGRTWHCQFGSQMFKGAIQIFYVHNRKSKQKITIELEVSLDLKHLK